MTLILRKNYLVMTLANATANGIVFMAGVDQGLNSIGWSGVDPLSCISWAVELLHTSYIFTTAGEIKTVGHVAS